MKEPDPESKKRLINVLFDGLLRVQTVPSKRHLIGRASITERQLMEIDGEHQVLNQMWRLSERKQAIFLELLNAASPMPSSLEDLFDFIAQAEIQGETETLKALKKQMKNNED